MQKGQAFQKILSILGRKSNPSPTVDLTTIQERIGLVGALDFGEVDLAANRADMQSSAKQAYLDVRTINWFIPYFNFAFYGGIHNIFRFADYYQGRKGVENRFILYDRPSITEEEIRSKISAAFPRLKSVPIYIKREPDTNKIPECDVAIATLWTSAFHVLKFRKARRKFYFIQDYEPLFYPAGTLYALAEATYRFGFYGIINTPGLHQFYTRKHQVPSVWWVPAVDKKVFYPPRSRGQGKFNILFYARPESDRNAFEIGIEALRMLKNRHGDKVEIFIVGSSQLSFFRGHDNLMKNLGLISYRAMADLYRNCHAGLAMMLTPHPSLLPLEMMASGTATVQNYNTNNTWLLKHGVNCLLTEPTITCICEKFEQLMHDPSLRSHLAANGLKTISQYSWEIEMDKVFNFISNPNCSIPGEMTKRKPSADLPAPTAAQPEELFGQRTTLRLETIHGRLNVLSERVDLLQNRLDRYRNLAPIKWARRIRRAVFRLPPPS